jgi:hypothetical protein
MYPMHLMVSADNEVGLAWLESALEHAFARGEMVLVAYLEEVMDEVLFEMELDLPPNGSQDVVQGQTPRL